MSYLTVVALLVGVTGVLTAVSAIRPGFVSRMRACAFSALVLIVLTAVFDNVIIAVGLVSYSSAHLSGLHIGLAPIEDFSYALCAAFFVPAVRCLLSPAKERP